MMTQQATSAPEARTSPVQFSVRGLFVLTAMCAGVAGAARLNVILAVELALGGLLLASLRVLGTYRGPLATLLAVPMLLIGFQWAMNARVYSCTRRDFCVNNLSQLRQALELYKQANGNYPPAFIADSNGKPLHSWRVLILPYLEQESTYDQYRFDEPWDGPNNRLLAPRMPAVYRCLNDATAVTNTSYVAMAAPSAAADSSLPDDNSAAAKPVTQLIEVGNSGVNWMEPRDWNPETMRCRIRSVGQSGVTVQHGGSARVRSAGADAPVSSDDVTPAQFEKLLNDSLRK